MIRVLKTIAAILRDGARAARAAKTRRIVERPQLASWEQDSGNRPSAGNDNVGVAQALSFAGSGAFKAMHGDISAALNVLDEMIVLDPARTLH